MGDERCNFYLSSEGQVLMPDADGLLYFADTAADGRLQRSEFPATSAQRASSSLKALQPAISKSVAAKQPKVVNTAPLASGTENVSKGVGLYADPHVRGTGSPRCLIILAQYTDVKFTTSNAGEYFNNMINQKGFNRNGATGSALDYFTEASMGQFNPVFDVLGPVTLPNARSYYGGNDAYGNDKAPEDMVRHAAKILADKVDFSVYDNDGDGVVDNVYVIYAGGGEASGAGASTVWPHSWDLSESTGGKYKVGNVYLDHYACSNEIEGGVPDGIGTFVHEFSHVLGLPDLYTTDYGSAASRTPGSYSVLDYGPYNNDGRTPPTYSVYERNAMGWIDCEVLDKPCVIEMEHILTSNKAYIIPTASKNEFFLLENRQQQGSDKYIPGHGMLIWHIDYKTAQWTYNTVNNNSSHQYVDIEEACGTANNNNATTMAGYPFPGTKNVTSFTSATTPALKTWSGVAIDMPITEIAEKNGVITALAAGGAPVPTLDAPEINPTAEITSDGFTASWQPVEGATDYLLTVYTYNSSGNLQLPVVGFDNSSLPTGWTATRQDWYRTAAYAGESVPSFRFAANGRYLQTAEFDGVVTGLSFWAIALPGDASKPASSLKILNGTALKGTEITTLSTLTSRGARYEIDADFDHAAQLSFVAQLTNGYIAIDDIAITVKGETSEVAPGYDSRSTAGECQLKVSGLPAADKYAYSVVALNDELKSQPSPLVYVSAPSGICDVAGDENDAPVEYFNLQGMRIHHPTPGSVVITKQGNKISKTIF